MNDPSTAATTSSVHIPHGLADLMSSELGVPSALNRDGLTVNRDQSRDQGGSSQLDRVLQRPELLGYSAVTCTGRGGMSSPTPDREGAA